MKRLTKIKIISTIVMVIALIVSVVFMMKLNQKVTFYIDDKEVSEYKKDVEYTQKLSYSYQDIHLKAKQNGKDITDQIKYKKIKIDQLKTYKIKYTVEDATFIYYMNVVDTKKPKIQGETQIEINQDDNFDANMCNISVSDNFDKNLQDKVKMEGSVDTSTPDTYTLTFSVSDSSNNKATHTCKIIVKKVEKPIVKSTPQPNQPSKPNTPAQNVVSNPNDIHVLINKTHYLPDGWAPNDLVSIGNGHKLRSEAADHLIQMRNAASADGIYMNVVSSYRSQAYQANLFNSYMAKDPINAPFYSAYPRTSEHELGLAIDISYNNDLHDDLQNSSLGVWMENHAHEYGFILRYAYNKTNMTGYVYEPWHYRYVGRDLAIYLKTNNLILEEY